MDRGTLFDMLDTIERIDKATSPQGVVDELSSCLRRHGFNAYLITRLPAPQDKNWDRQILANGWPQDWHNHYQTQGHYRHDPCASRSRAASDPFLWSELADQSMTDRARNVMHEAASFGLRQGICVPIHSPSSPPAAVSIAGEFVDLAPITIHIVPAIARHAFRSLLWSIGARDGLSDPILSGREREILQWTAAGKTAWEISQILGISQHTANTHLKNARQKLGAVNVAHSVVEALRRREIQF